MATHHRPAHTYSAARLTTAVALCLLRCLAICLSLSASVRRLQRIHRRFGYCRWLLAFKFTQSIIGLRTTRHTSDDIDCFMTVLSQ